ncbi:type 1 glutamine amidotransferase domain-containing protein [Sinomonas notoginsengisoli]|uniref:type 1 glutamine amidotransferase domain-containing protein n=1 Tax=Sinomonas notoginsengisoli TaxID=1457311 RepID=UPI001F233685|nr:type 1 glutamine amidotransferase domain-containing protein [Sinomonas notoginsengisoli]
MTQNTTGNITGKKVAFLLTKGVEQSELTEPWKAVEQAGGQPVLVSPESGQVTAMTHDWDHGESFAVDVPLSQARAEDFDALVLPGGSINADRLRLEGDAVALVKSFAEAGKPISAICHAPWILIEAGLVQGRRMTSYASLQTDLRNAGADWVDEQVVTDRGLTTSRNPGDLEAFCSKMLEEISEGQHAEI